MADKEITANEILADFDKTFKSISNGESTKVVNHSITNVRDEKKKVDLNTFFRDMERTGRTFLNYWEFRAKGNKALYPYQMTMEEWWLSYIRWLGSNEGERTWRKAGK